MNCSEIPNSQHNPDFDTEKVNIYVDFFTEFMLPPQTYTIVHEGVEAKFWVVTFAEQVFNHDEGVKVIVKYGVYSYN